MCIKVSYFSYFFPVRARVVFLVNLSLTSNLAVDPVHVRAHSRVYRERFSGTRSACSPRGRSTDDPLATLTARQGATTVTITDTGSPSPNANHLAVNHFCTVSLAALAKAGHWGYSLSEGRSEVVVV